MRPRSPATFASLALLTLLAVAPPDPARADAAAWRDKFAKADADGVFLAIEAAGTGKAKDAGLPLLEAGIEARYPHLAVACGDALRALDGWPTGDAAAEGEVKKLVGRALKAKELEKQQNLARVLGAWAHPLVDEPLASLAAGQKPPEVQTEALYMCGALPVRTPEAYPETILAIEKAIKGRTEQIRMAACSAAGRRKAAIFRDPLVSVVRTDKDDYPGLYAAWALKQMGATAPVDTFVHVLENNPKRQTKEACLKAITDLAGLVDVPALLSLTRHAKVEYRDAAALALGRMAWRGVFRKQVTPEPIDEVPPEIVDRLVQMVAEDSDYQPRDAARQGLLRMRSSAAAKVAEAMPRVLDASEEDARQTAIELCGLFGVKDEATTRALLKIAVFDRSPVARMFAARAVGSANPEKAAQELLKSAAANRRGGDEPLRAVRALGYVKHRAAFDGLVAMIAEDAWSEEMLREAEFALERLTGHRFGRKPERWKTWIGKHPKPFELRPKHFDRVANRRDAVKSGRFGITPATEKAVEDGLRWLERQQHPTGEWDGNEKGFGGVANCQPAYTGLCLLAFLGAGYGEKEGKHRENVRRASEFLAATQFYDGGFPVTGGGDNSWIYAYLVAMGIWGINESFGLSDDPALKGPAQWGIDYLVRVQTPGAGWRYGPRYTETDTSCTSWVLMTMKTADLLGLDVAQKSFDGIDAWLERCSYDITGEEEVPEDLSNDYDHEVGSRRYFKAFTGYFALSGAEKNALQMTSMTAVGMVCRFFMGWRRSHPFLIGSANFLVPDYVPQWMKGLEKGMAIAWYHYYWYYGTLAMHQMGGRFWRQWNDKIKRMYEQNRRTSPPELAGSWDPDTALLNGGRLFSTPMSILTLETYYRFSPIMTGDVEKAPDEPPKKPDGGN